MAIHLGFSLILDFVINCKTLTESQKTKRNLYNKPIVTENEENDNFLNHHFAFDPILELWKERSMENWKQFRMATGAVTFGWEPRRLPVKV